jgi:peroxiredoxin Q/BCP
MKWLRLLALSAVVFPVLTASAALEVGDTVSPFAANADSGELWQLSEHLGQKNIVVYFYPAAMTGGCTKQACAYRDESAALNAANALVVGVSGDAVNGLALFKQVNALNFTLLSDPSGTIAELFGVATTHEARSLEREVNGVTHTLDRGVTTRRWTFVIGKDGTVVYKNDSVQAASDASEVLKVLKSLG